MTQVIIGARSSFYHEFTATGGEMLAHEIYSNMFGIMHCLTTYVHLVYGSIQGMFSACRVWVLRAHRWSFWESFVIVVPSRALAATIRIVATMHPGVHVNPQVLIEEEGFPSGHLLRERLLKCVFRPFGSLWSVL